MAVNFKDLLSKPMDSVERPAALPAGTYYGSVKNYDLGESKEKKTPYVRFNLTLHSAGEDIDESEISGMDLTKKLLRRDFFITPDSEYRLKDFIESCGIKTRGRSFAETLPEVVGAQVIISVTQRPAGDAVYNDVNVLKGAP